MGSLGYDVEDVLSRADGQRPRCSGPVDRGYEQGSTWLIYKVETGLSNIIL